MADPKNGMSFVGRAELREAELNQFQKIMGVVDDLPALLRGVRGWQKPAAVGTGVWIGGKWYPNKKKQEGEYQYESMTRRGKLREASLIPIEGRLSKVWRSIKGAAARSTKYVKGRASDIAEPVKRFGRTVGGGAALVGLGGLGAVVMPMASDPQEESDRICRRAMLCEAGGFYAERLKNVVEPFMANRTAQLRRRMKAQPEFAKIVGETVRTCVSGTARHARFRSNRCARHWNDLPSNRVSSRRWRATTRSGA